MMLSRCLDLPIVYMGDVNTCSGHAFVTHWSQLHALPLSRGGYLHFYGKKVNHKVRKAHLLYAQ